MLKTYPPTLSSSSSIPVIEREFRWRECFIRLLLMATIIPFCWPSCICCCHTLFFYCFSQEMHWILFCSFLSFAEILYSKCKFVLMLNEKHETVPHHISLIWALCNFLSWLCWGVVSWISLSNADSEVLLLSLLWWWWIGKSPLRNVCILVHVVLILLWWGSGLFGLPVLYFLWNEFTDLLLLSFQRSNIFLLILCFVKEP